MPPWPCYRAGKLGIAGLALLISACARFTPAAASDTAASSTKLYYLAVLSLHAYHWPHHQRENGSLQI